MTDFIEREAVFRIVHGFCHPANIEDEIAKLPAADVVEVRRGKWLTTDAFPHRVYCSVCYKTIVPNDRWQIWVDGDLPRNFCPACGAKMEV